VLVGLLTQEITTFDGTYYRRTDARCEPKGPPRPHPPICIGGSGEKRTLRTTARYAQHWNFGGGTPDEFAHKRDVLYAHCADLGRDPKQITLSSHVRLGADGNVDAVAETAAALAAVRLDLAIVYLPPEQQQPAVLGPLADAPTSYRCKGSASVVRVRTTVSSDRRRFTTPSGCGSSGLSGKTSNNGRPTTASRSMKVASA
jgi:alkanesulfonate monooxygenase SsuD/methylene tetrahydromethanopterin reductase-like flavin-dependent oxidoreductase (luciferase family)